LRGKLRDSPRKNSRIRRKKLGNFWSSNNLKSLQSLNLLSIRLLQKCRQHLSLRLRPQVRKVLSNRPNSARSNRRRSIGLKEKTRRLLQKSTKSSKLHPLRKRLVQLTPLLRSSSPSSLKKWQLRWPKL
jgi:hypothetical protein